MALSVMMTEILAPPNPRRLVWVVGAAGEVSPERWEQYYLLTSAFGVARFYAPGACLDRSWAALARARYQGYLKLGPEVWALAFVDESGPLVAAWSEAPRRVSPGAAGAGGGGGGVAQERGVGGDAVAAGAAAGDLAGTGHAGRAAGDADAEGGVSGEWEAGPERPSRSSGGLFAGRAGGDRIVQPRLTRAAGGGGARGAADG